MRIHGVSICGLKGVDVDIPWSSAVVLFGPNDSGKSNILEAFGLLLGAEKAVRCEPPYSCSEDAIEELVLDSETELELCVELDGLGIEGHPDQRFFLSLLAFDPCGENDDPRWAEIAAAFKGLKLKRDEARATAELVERVRQLVCELVGDRKTRDGRTIELGAEALRSNYFMIRNEEALWLAPTGKPLQFRPIFQILLGFAVWDKLPLETIRIQSSAESLDALRERLERHLEAEDYGFLPTVPNFDPWVERSEDSVSLRPTFKRGCARLTARVNEVAPEFISRSYEIRIEPLLPDEWYMHRGRHAAIRLHPRAQGDRAMAFDVAVASSGIVAWTSYALAEAMREREEERRASQSRIREILDEDGEWSWADDPPRPPQATVYIFDEPEAHLHPLAQEEAAAWLAERARMGGYLLMATHALPFLQLPLSDVEYLRVHRSQDWTTTVVPITDDVLGAVEESASALGLSPVALIQLTRGWLVVEGEHDRKILDAYFGSDLRQSRVRVLPLRGAMRAKASFLNLEALAGLGIPFFCLLDNARVHAIENGELPTDKKTEEERIAEQILRLRDETPATVEVLGLPYPDIICALPFEAVCDVACKNGGKPQASSWHELIDQHGELRRVAAERGEKASDFKSFALGALGLKSWSADQLVNEVLLASDARSPRDGGLSRIVSRVLACVEGRPVEIDAAGGEPAGV